MESNNIILPHLEPPSDFEVMCYYYSFASHPRLIGRTSSGTTPWWRLDKDDEETKELEYEANFWGRSTGLEYATAYGRVGNHHAIHQCWEETTLQKVEDALQGLDYSSIDVLRIGRTKVPPSEHPVIVWVGVNPVLKNFDEREDHPWPLIAAKLRAVRKVLDEDGLSSVE